MGASSYFIQKHTRTIATVILIIGGLALLRYLPVGSSIFSMSATPTPTATPDYSTWRTYNNPKYGVSLKYPLTFQARPGQIGPLAEWSLYGLTNGNEIGSIQIPRSFESRTNFDDASLRMGVSTEPIAVTDCVSPPASFGYKDTYASRTIGGVDFRKFTRSDAGAGNYYEFTSYRAVRNGGCEVLEYVVHYSNIQNYPAESGIKEYDKQKVVDSLESILDTVKFSK